MTTAAYSKHWDPTHPNAFKNGLVADHVAEAVKARGGRPLPPDAEVDHVNGDRSDNRHANLVVCQDRAYHMLLHQRRRALQVCGHPDWRKCVYCKRYSPIAEMRRDPPNSYMYHPKCQVAYARFLRQRKRAQRKEQAA